MGVNINVGMDQDYSYLFQNLSGGSENLNFLSDYASIKNGSYSKLMKAYYGTAQSSNTKVSDVAGSSAAAASKSTKSSSKTVLDKILDAKKNPKVSSDTQKANANLTSGLSRLNGSLSTLKNEGTYTDTENGQSAADKVVSAVKAYVSDYNNVINAAKGSTMTNKTAYVANMMSTTAANADKLSEIGVRVNSNGTLEINEEKLKAVDLSKVQELFSSDVTSYGSTVGSRVQFAGGASSGTSAADAVDSTGTNNTTASSASTLKADGKALASDELFEMIKDAEGNKKYDIEKIFATVKSFVKNYNSMFDAAEASSNSGVVANLSHIREKTASSTDILKQFGITVDEKGRMKVDEDTFKKSDMSEVQKFFKDYGSSVATNASLVDYYMTTQANAANGYTAAGGYNVQGNSSYVGTV